MTVPVCVGAIAAGLHGFDDVNGYQQANEHLQSSS